MHETPRGALTTLGAEQYVALTSYRADGSEVTTPVWIAPGSDRLLVWTPASSGKVKRLRRDGRVIMAPCDREGTITGPSAGGRARVLPSSELPRARRAMLAKYGWKFREFTALLRIITLLRLNKLLRNGRLRRASGGPVAVEITLDAPDRG